MSKTIKDSNNYKHYSRMDIIGQNGNDGEHYDEVDAIKYIEEHYDPEKWIEDS